MPFSPSDDRPHAPEPNAAWAETWGFTFSAGRGVDGLVRVTLRREVVWWWTLVRGLDPGLIVVRDEELAPPRRAGSLELRGDGIWAELVCETPFEHWGIALEAFGLVVETAMDEIGDRVPVGLDLEWEIDASSAVDETGAHGYTQTGVLRGEVLVGTDRYEIDARCTRDHSWGAIELPKWT